jgi:hypothetical protein
VTLGKLVRRESKVRLAQRVTLEILDLLVQILQFLDLRVTQVILDLLAHRVSRASRVRQEQLELVEL